MATYDRPQSRALRIGVLLGGTLVEERIFRADGKPITIGQSLRCRLSIPVDGLPVEHVLFAPLPTGGWQLCLPSGTTGRIADGPIHELTAESPRRSAVGHGARGKLQLGQATLLFQELAAPPVMPRPQLPASVRGSLVDRVDRRLAVAVGGSLVAHIAIALYAWQIDPPSQIPPPAEAAFYEPAVTELPAEVIDPPAPPPATPSTDNAAPGTATPAEPRRQTPRGNPNQPLGMPDPVDPNRWAQIMTGNSETPNGHNAMNSRSPGATLEQQIADIKANQRDIKTGNSPRSRDGGERRGTNHGFEAPDGNGIERNHSSERELIARLTPLPRPPDIKIRTPTTPEMVVARIVGSYLGPLKRCYVKHGLAADPNLAARVQLSFTITTSGTLDDSQARGANPDVDSCIRDEMKSWRFQVPKDEDGDPTEAPFQVTLVLQPS